MSDSIKHECGIAFIRLLKPLNFYLKKYNTITYGLNKLHLLMEKQRNRGQDGAGIALIKLDTKPGNRYISRQRAIGANAVPEIFDYIQKKFASLQEKSPNLVKDAAWLKEHVSFTGEVLLGHLRYGTHGKNSLESCHPFLRQNNWMTRNLVLAGNVNMTNVDELLNQLYELGQHPKEKSDTVTVLEKIGHFLDTENQELFNEFKLQGYSNAKISQLIGEHLDVARILQRSAKNWDGGYAIGGILGHGDAFIMRDPSGIRPAYFFQNEEVVVAASERSCIQTAFNTKQQSIQEIKPGHALIIKKNGCVSQELFSEPQTPTPCSFERIYFSRGSDAAIYQERKQLGKLLSPQVLKSVDYNFEDTVFSFIPNTAETAFYGLIESLHQHIKSVQEQALLNPDAPLTKSEIKKILSLRPRIEKIAIKDAKLRTFITQDRDREDMVAHVYDTTYGVVNPGKDSLVLLDDSIVRGTTLKQSILKIMDRLGPQKIIIVSSAPQIRYPDCYGIDMSRMGEFVAFEAAIALLKEKNMENLIFQVYENCKADLSLGNKQPINHVQAIYAPLHEEEIAKRVAEIITPKEIQAKVCVIYQTLENLHKACPNHLGDWYFSGHYPTPGGNKVVNKAFINWMEGVNQRAYS